MGENVIGQGHTEIVDVILTAMDLIGGIDVDGGVGARL